MWASDSCACVVVTWGACEAGISEASEECEAETWARHQAIQGMGDITVAAAEPLHQRLQLIDQPINATTSSKWPRAAPVVTHAAGPEVDQVTHAAPAVAQAAAPAVPQVSQATSPVTKAGVPAVSQTTASGARGCVGGLVGPAPAVFGARGSMGGPAPAASCADTSDAAGSPQDQEGGCRPSQLGPFEPPCPPPAVALPPPAAACNQAEEQGKPWCSWCGSKTELSCPLAKCNILHADEVLKEALRQAALEGDAAAAEGRILHEVVECFVCGFVLPRLGTMPCMCLCLFPCLGTMPRYHALLCHGTLPQAQPSPGGEKAGAEHKGEHTRQGEHRGRSTQGRGGTEVTLGCLAGHRGEKAAVRCG